SPGTFNTQAAVPADDEPRLPIDSTEKTTAPLSPMADASAPAPDPGAPLATDNPALTTDPTTPDPDTKDGTTSPDEIGATDNPAAPKLLAAVGGINRCPVVPGLPIKKLIIEAWLAKDLLQFLPGGAAGIVYNSKFAFFDPAGIVFINAADCA